MQNARRFEHLFAHIVIDEVKMASKLVAIVGSVTAIARTEGVEKGASDGSLV